MTEPMTDAELAALRHIHKQHGLSLRPPGEGAFDRLFALVDTLKARALPEPRLMRTVEEVEALPVGLYRVRGDGGDLFYERRGPHDWRIVGGYSAHASDLTDCLVCGPLPDLPTPTAAQEGQGNG